jgi:hypothetical protein
MSYLTKKNNKNNKNYNHNNHNNNNHNKNKHKYNNKNKKLTKSQRGGSSFGKEKFEVQSLTNFDFDKISISKDLNANIDWGIMPGPPPKPDCTIL